MNMFEALVASLKAVIDDATMDDAVAVHEKLVGLVSADAARRFRDEVVAVRTRQYQAEYMRGRRKALLDKKTQETEQ